MLVRQAASNERTFARSEAAINVTANRVRAQRKVPKMIQTVRPSMLLAITPRLSLM
jgi:hypothetical protein